MTLIVDLFDPVVGPYSYLHAIDCTSAAAGFESYRKELWGSKSLRDRGCGFFPQLAEADLFDYPQDLAAFADECHKIDSESESIAVEIWGSDSDGSNIREYMTRFQSAVTLARERGVGVCIS